MQATQRKWFSITKRWWHKATDLTSNAAAQFLQSCVICHDAITEHNRSIHAQKICSLCWQCLPWIDQHCGTCGLPLAVSAIQCGVCANQRLSYERCFCPLRYDFPVDILIRNFKDARQWPVKSALVDLLNSAHQELDFKQFDFIAAVPSHWRKRWQRGFNHSYELAVTLAKQHNIPLVTDFKRVKFGQDQRLLTRKERLKNLENTFVCKQDLSGQHVLLLDDVVTTGATIESAAKALVAAGAKPPVVLSIARTPARQKPTTR